ncbi:MAG: hypothetical protein ACTHK7_09800 [Aureliella sp.]
MKPNQIQFTARVIIAACAVTAVAVVLALCWIEPYAIMATYPNGQRAYEQWERRTLTGKIEHIKTVRWFPDGKPAFEGRAAGGGGTYWAPNGKRFDGADRDALLEWYRQYGRLIDGHREPTPRPHAALLEWLNRQ